MRPGPTIEAVKVLRKNGFSKDIEDAMSAAIEKSKEMTK